RSSGNAPPRPARSALHAADAPARPPARSRRLLPVANPGPSLPALAERYRAAPSILQVARGIVRDDLSGLPAGGQRLPGVGGRGPGQPAGGREHDLAGQLLRPEPEPLPQLQRGRGDRRRGPQPRVGRGHHPQQQPDACLGPLADLLLVPPPDQRRVHRHAPPARPAQPPAAVRSRAPPPAAARRLPRPARRSPPRPAARSAPRPPTRPAPPPGAAARTGRNGHSSAPPRQGRPAATPPPATPPRRAAARTRTRSGPCPPAPRAAPARRAGAPGR